MSPSPGRHYPAADAARLAVNCASRPGRRLHHVLEQAGGNIDVAELGQVEHRGLEVRPAELHQGGGRGGRILSSPPLARIPNMHRTGLAALLALASAAVAQPQKPVPTAITGARVVVSADKTLAKATVLLRDGLIADVIEGDDVPVPPDALVIDGSGLTVYPGLID